MPPVTHRRLVGRALPGSGRSSNSGPGSARCSSMVAGNGLVSPLIASPKHLPDVVLSSRTGHASHQQHRRSQLDPSGSGDNDAMRSDQHPQQQPQHAPTGQLRHAQLAQMAQLQQPVQQQHAHLQQVQQQQQQHIAEELATPAPVAASSSGAAAPDDLSNAYHALLLRLYETAQQMLLGRMGYERLTHEFAAVIERDDHIDLSTSIGTSQRNRSRNRYADVLPYDRSRVVLPLPTPCAVPRLPCTTQAMTLTASQVTGGMSDYINASYVRDESGEPAATSGYVAAQGPLPSTVCDFWEMVRGVNASAVVMLTNFAEHGRNKCELYFPEEERDTLVLPTGVSIKCVHASQLCDGVVFRQLEAAYPATPANSTNGFATITTNSGAASTSTDTAAAGTPAPVIAHRQWLNHYHYTSWPDFGVPTKSDGIRAVSHALDSCRRAGTNIVVHCSAGIGRTGTFCAVDIVLQRLDRLRQRLGALGAGGLAGAAQQGQQGQQGQQRGLDLTHALKDVLNIPAIVHHLRKQRMGMVQTSDQYAFCYTAVGDELRTLTRAARRELALLQQEQQGLQHVPPRAGGTQQQPRAQPTSNGSGSN